MIIEYSLFLVIIFAFVFVYYKAHHINSLSVGTDKMKELCEVIKKGAMTFLKRIYKILIVFVIIVSALLWAFLGWKMAVTFVFGALFSALAGNIGMRTATSANARTAHACKKGLNDGLKVAFASGTVMGITVTSLGLLGVLVFYLIFKDPNIIYGFGFGASSIALFARVGGGIFTKAADVGADLAGKVEKNIPEDDPRNPAVIADNVGDNVGDVAGMGADLFESYVDSIIAAMVLGVALSIGMGVILPLVLAGIGIVSSIIGTWLVKIKNKGCPSHALNKGIFGSAIIMTVLSFLFIKFSAAELHLFYSAMTGLVAGIIIGLITEYYTSEKNKPTQSIAKSAKTGAGTAVIQGLSVGMISTIVPIVTVCAAIFFADYFSGLYGIAIAAVGMLSTLGITLASDTYGPVVDNAAGIAEMAKLGGVVRKRAEKLDAVGNTTAAIGKGFAIGSTALTALALFVSYKEIAGLDVINLTQPLVIIGLFLGGLMPFVFSALTMDAVGKAAEKMVEEVRRQFKTIKGLMSGKVKPDYDTCVDISTQAALKHMILPSVLAVIVPIAIGLFLGVEALGGLLIGTLITGFLLAVFMANSGGAWDNAKKYVEAGHFGGKGSAVHKATVVGDTVGDPFKDTSGPALNILIKLMSIVALVFLPLFL